MEDQLFDAIELGCIETISTLLSQGANINVTNIDGNTLLHKAVLKQNEEAVKFLIDSGIDINLKNNDGETAFKYTFNYSNNALNCSIMKLLVNAGADPNSTNESGGTTALHYAVSNGDVNLAKLLITRGANVNAKDKSFCHWRPLHYAARHVSSEEPTIFEILANANADVNAKSFINETPLHILMKFRFKVPLSLCKILEVFYKYKADFYATDMDGWTPMDYAILHSNTEGVRALVLCGGVDVNSEFMSALGKKETILHSACYKLDMPTVKFLLKNGANINALDNNKMSPLHHVIDSPIYNVPWNTNTVLFDYLLEWNPDVNTITTDGFNILNSRHGFNLLDTLHQTILKHLAKLFTMQSPIHPSLFETISSNSEFENYFEKCNEELQTAKNSKLHPDSWVTFFNILLDDEIKLIHYAGNSDLTNMFSDIDFLEKYPIYGAQIRKRFSKAVENRKIWNRAAETLSQLLPIKINPDHRAIIKIMNLLNLKDLRKLCL